MANLLEDYAKDLKGVDAPYNFVPLNGSVFRDQDAFRVSQDLPFSDGISGTISIELETITPACVGNEQHTPTNPTTGERTGPSEIRPLEMPDGRVAMGGASLRGAIRSVLEIASFSRMQRYDNPAMSLRDLAGPVSEIYRKKLVDDEAKGFRYKGHAGWLEKSEHGWHIRKCQFTRVTHSDLHSLSNQKWEGFTGYRDQNGKWQHSKSARKKYEEWLSHNSSLNVQFDAVEKVDEKSNIEGSFAVRFGADAGNSGLLVFTGQPAGYKADQLGATKRKKCREFIFHDEGNVIEIESSVLAAFFQVHKDSEELKFLRSSTFQKQANNRKSEGVQLRIPVFFLEDKKQQGRVESLGLALMYRMPYQFDFKHAVGQSSEEHHGSQLDDLGSLLFGAIDGEGKTTLKGRVQFGTLTADNSEIELEAHRVTLNGPKPSFYPAYLMQPGQKQGKSPTKTYNTLQNEKAMIRGRKRYPVRPTHEGRATGNDKLDTVLHCMPSGTRLTGKLRFHNLRPFELGALLWSLTFGQREHCHHSIGAGKPYGFGQTRVSISRVDGRSMAGAVVDMDDLMKGFVDRMEDWASSNTGDGWFSSDPMQNLITMADPASAVRWEEKSQCKLRYLRPEGDGFGDKDMPQLHQKIKGQKLVLPSYAALLPDQLAETVDPAIEEWVDNQVSQIAKATNAPQDQALRGKLLLAKVSELDDANLKIAICQCIRAKWSANGFWTEPPGKAAKKTKLGYLEILGKL